MVLDSNMSYKRELFDNWCCASVTLFCSLKLCSRGAWGSWGFIMAVGEVKIMASYTRSFLTFPLLSIYDTVLHFIIVNAPARANATSKTSASAPRRQPVMWHWGDDGLHLRFSWDPARGKGEVPLWWAWHPGEISFLAQPSAIPAQPARRDASSTSNTFSLRLDWTGERIKRTLWQARAFYICMCVCLCVL